MNRRTVSASISSGYVFARRGFAKAGFFDSLRDTGYLEFNQVETTEVS